MSRSARRREHRRMTRLAGLRLHDPRRWASEVSELKRQWALAARQTAREARHRPDGPVVAVMRFIARKANEARKYGIEKDLVAVCLDALTSIPNGRVGRSSVRTLRLNEAALLSTHRAPFAVGAPDRDVVPP